ncbi:MAG: molybdopterin-dependent oxidoreductase [Desulfobacterales bacterium]|nr:MAG: molybdopterin-dependent oxidoreductase [Desulfobacterales bacterium]
MEKRRQFLKTTFGFLTGMGLSLSPFFKAVRTVYGNGKTPKIVLPRDTNRESLIHKDPGVLDTRNLELTPLKDFRTMGISDYEVQLDAWRLEVTGRVQTPLRLTYPQILTLSSIEREVLLICPGVFTNHGRWKGLSMGQLLTRAQLEKDVTHGIFAGPEGAYEKTERFPIEDILTDKVFLAYGVNGETLPLKHGFPLRVVAEGYYGSDWVKYVHRLELDKI